MINCFQNLISNSTCAASQWTSLNNSPPGSSAFHFEVRHNPPRMQLHPELREWFLRVSQMRPRTWARAYTRLLFGST